MISGILQNKTPIGLGPGLNKISAIILFIRVGNIFLCRIVIGTSVHGIMQLPHILNPRRIVHRLPHLCTSPFVSAIVDDGRTRMNRLHQCF